MLKRGECTECKLSLIKNDLNMNKSVQLKCNSTVMTIKTIEGTIGEENIITCECFQKGIVVQIEAYAECLKNVEGR